MLKLSFVIRIIAIIYLKIPFVIGNQSFFTFGKKPLSTLKDLGKSTVFKDDYWSMMIYIVKLQA